MDPETLAFYALLSIVGIVVLREIRKMTIENMRLKLQGSKLGAQAKRWEGLFENLPLAIESTEAMLFEMKSKVPPPTPEQIAPVEKRLHQLHTVAANQWWIEIVLRMMGPTADRVIKWFI
jgi:hypothetical protein